MNAVPRPCPERELLLHGLADGELDAANALAMEEHVRGCAHCDAAYAEILHQKQLLKGDGMRFRAPAELRDWILAAIEEEGGASAAARLEGRSPRDRARIFSFAKAGTAFSALALVASLVLFVSSFNAAPHIEDELVAGHVRSLLVSHLTDVASSDQHTVKPWFMGKLDFAPPVVDLAQKDFPLVGGRLDYVAGRVVAALVYKRHGHIINLFIWPANTAAGPTGTLEGYHIVSWTQAGFTYAAVSDLNLTELRDFQHDLQRSL
jgi:anti-sigma factor RsiW